MSEIGRRAGVGQATLYRHFPTRDDLVLTIFCEEVDRLESEASARAGDPTAFVALVEAMVTSQVRFHGLADCLATPRGVDVRIDALQERVDRLLAGPLGDAVEAGLVRSDLTVEDVTLVMAMVDGALRQQRTVAGRQGAVERVVQLAFGSIVKAASRP